MQNSRYKYNAQKRNAARRNISWDLTYDTWIAWWIDTGHAHERGRGYGKYVMSRYNDVGPYALNNIFCSAHGQNVSQAQKGKIKAPAHATKLRANLDNIRKKYKVITPDGEYESGYECARHYNITGEAVYWRCNQTSGQFKEWHRANN